MLSAVFPGPQAGDKGVVTVTDPDWCPISRVGPGIPEPERVAALIAHALERRGPDDRRIRLSAP